VKVAANNTMTSLYKSPAVAMVAVATAAVAMVSRPYSWHTLAACVHNCTIMMFRTFCWPHPKCKRNYLL